MKRAGGRRFYRPRDIAAMKTLKRLLHDEGMSIAEAQSLYRARRRSAGAGVKAPIRLPWLILRRLRRAGRRAGQPGAREGPPR